VTYSFRESGGASRRRFLHIKIYWFIGLCRDFLGFERRFAPVLNNISVINVKSDTVSLT